MIPAPGVRLSQFGNQLVVEMPLGPWRLNRFFGEWSRPRRTVVLNEDGTIARSLDDYRYGPWTEPTRFATQPYGPLFLNEVLRLPPGADGGIPSVPIVMRERWAGQKWGVMPQ